MSKPSYFKVPKCLKHKEARKIITDLVRNMNEKGLFTESDVPNLCRMAIAYDMISSGAFWHVPTREKAPLPSEWTIKAFYIGLRHRKPRLATNCWKISNAGK